MIKYLFPAICCFLFVLQAQELPLDSFRSLHATDAELKNGRFSGIPGPGSSLRAFVHAEDGGFNHVCAIVSGRSAGQLTLSLRGKTQLSVKAKAGAEPGSFLFDFPQLPAGFRELRLYYNAGGKDSGKKITFQLVKIALEKKRSTVRLISSLPMVPRKRLADHIYIFPRIQSKYDLVKNYLGGYSLGTGTFFDRPLFFDRSLAGTPLPVYDKLNTPASFRRQLASAREFTDGFAIFISGRKERFLKPLEYVKGTSWKNSIFVECTPAVFQNPEAVYESIDRALAQEETFRINGNLVIGSYHGQAFSPEKWKKVLAPLRKRYGGKILFLCELRGVCYALNTAYRKNNGAVPEELIERSRRIIREYLKVMDGVNFSGTNHLTAEKPGFPEHVFNADGYEKIIVPLFAGVLAEPEFNGKKLLGLSAHKVYAQVRSTRSNVDEEGTAGLRRSLAAALAANPDYIVMPEWNEVNENTHLEPVVSDARTNQRVMEAMRGRTIAETDPRYPNLILSFRQDNEWGAAIPIELLGLPDPGAPETEAVLKLYAPNGKLLKTFSTLRFSHKGLEPHFFLEVAGNYAKFRFLVPELELKQKGKTTVLRRGLPLIRLTGAPNNLHRYVKIPLRDLPDPQQIVTRFSYEAGIVSATGKVQIKEPLATLELLADDTPVAAVDPRNEFTAPNGMKLLCWRCSIPLVSGLGTNNIRIEAVRGSIRVRQPGQYGLAGMIPPVQKANVLQGPVGGGSAIREFLFFATPDAELKITQRGISVSVKVADVLKNGVFRKNLTCGVSWQLLSLRNLPEVPMPLDVPKLDFSLKAAALGHPGAVYTVRLITRSGRVFRSEGFLADTPPEEPQQLVPVWDLLTDRKKNIRVPAGLTRDITFQFTPEYGDLLPASDNDITHAGVLGGFDYRTHRAPGWDNPYSPVWRKDGAAYVLDFTPGCELLLPPPLFSRSAFTLEMEFSCPDTAEQILLNTLGNTMPVRLRQGKLSGELTTRKGKFRWESGASVAPGKKYTLKLHYDLNRFQVVLDGKKAADIPASGVFDDSWILCIGGAPVKPRKPAPDMFIPQGKASEKAACGFHFSGTLYRLRIANF